MDDFKKKFAGFELISHPCVANLFITSIKKRTGLDITEIIQATGAAAMEDGKRARRATRYR